MLSSEALILAVVNAIFAIMYKNNNDIKCKEKCRLRKIRVPDGI